MAEYDLRGIASVAVDGSVSDTQINDDQGGYPTDYSYTKSGNRNIEYNKRIDEAVDEAIDVNSLGWSTFGWWIYKQKARIAALFLLIVFVSIILVILFMYKGGKCGTNKVTLITLACVNIAVVGLYFKLVHKHVFLRKLSDADALFTGKKAIELQLKPLKQKMKSEIMNPISENTHIFSAKDEDVPAPPRQRKRYVIPDNLDEDLITKYIPASKKVSFNDSQDDAEPDTDETDQNIRRSRANADADLHEADQKIRRSRANADADLHQTKFDYGTIMDEDIADVRRKRYAEEKLQAYRDAKKKFEEENQAPPMYNAPPMYQAPPMYHAPLVYQAPPMYQTPPMYQAPPMYQVPYPSAYQV